MAEKKAGYRDEKAPTALQVIVCDGNGREWGRLYANTKNFSTGSVGFYGSEKIRNPDNPEAQYQAGVTITLVGSKP